MILKIENNALTIVMIGCAQFILLTTIAMFFYPGGTKVSPDTSGYSFFTNFFSDLGRTTALSGDPNPISATLFFIALFFSGCSFVLFFSQLPRFFNELLPEYDNILLLTRRTGLMSGFGFIGVAFTPANFINIVHDVFVVIAFGSLLFASLGLSRLIYLSKNFHIIHSLIFLVPISVIALYGVIGFTNYQVKTLESLFLRTTTQKLVVYSCIITYAIEALAIYRHHKTSLRSKKDSNSNSFN
ncbi:MAG: hypothetical protein ACTSPV_09010 [Candidatus Hodarchaeales archaeon]